MANYYASARSNYFRVKNIDEFVKDCPVHVEKAEKDGKTYCVILFEDGIEICDFSDENNPVDIDWCELFQKHLEKDSVAIFMESGNEKLRYICGYAKAYNSEGDELSISLADIYEMVNHHWIGCFEITEAEY